MLTRLRLPFSTQLQIARIMCALFPNADPLLIDWQTHTEGGSGLVPLFLHCLHEVKLPPLKKSLLLRPCAKHAQSNL